MRALPARVMATYPTEGVVDRERERGGGGGRTLRSGSASMPSSSSGPTAGASCSAKHAALQTARGLAAKGGGLPTLPFLLGPPPAAARGAHDWPASQVRALFPSRLPRPRWMAEES